MKDRSHQSGNPNRHSEVLNGKQPAADARLLRDIFGAKDTPTAPPRVIVRAKPESERRHHDAHIESKTAHQPGVTQWD